MRLYSFLHSPNPLKVRLALAELGLEHETVEVNLFKGEHRAEAFGRINPHRKVPVLDDGGALIPESGAILAHLGRTRGGALWPSSPRDEAQALRWLFFEAGHLMLQCGTLWWTDVVAPKIGRPGADAPVVKDAVEELERALHVLDRHLADRPFLLGEAHSLVDCSAGVSLDALRGTRLDVGTRWPNVDAYRQRVRARPSWAAAQGDAIHELT